VSKPLREDVAPCGSGRGSRVERGASRLERDVSRMERVRSRAEEEGSLEFAVENGLRDEQKC
jgi:hypothetical protein